MPGASPLHHPLTSSLLRGIDRIETEARLISRLERSAKTGTPLRVKLGIDASGPDIHLGFAVPLRLLRRFQDAGHIAVLIVGDFTGKIGDPTGRSRTRPQLTEAQIQENVARYREQAFRILRPDRCEFRYNSEWSDPLTAREIVNIASRYTVARIIEREDFRNRLKDRIPVYVHELLYPLFQGYDSVAVRADVELGGADQYWNLLVGRELQREFNQEPQVVITTPLLVGLDGTQKMSKSYGNYVAITDPPMHMFGKLMSIPDATIMDYFRLCTGRTDEELAEVEARLRTGNPRDIKAMLAREVVSIYHSPVDADRAAAEFDRVFRNGSIPKDMPDYKVPSAGVGIVTLVVDSGLLSSRSEARRKLAEGAFYIDAERVTDPDLIVRVEAGSRVLKVGKRRFIRLLPS